MTENHYNGFLIAQTPVDDYIVMIENEIELYKGWVIELTNQISQCHHTHHCEHLKAELHSFKHAIHKLQNEITNKTYENSTLS